MLLLDPGANKLSVVETVCNMTDLNIEEAQYVVDAAALKPARIGALRHDVAPKLALAIMEVGGRAVADVSGCAGNTSYGSC